MMGKIQRVGGATRVFNRPAGAQWMFVGSGGEVPGWL